MNCDFDCLFGRLVGLLRILILPVTIFALIVLIKKRTYLNSSFFDLTANSVAADIVFTVCSTIFHLTCSLLYQYWPESRSFIASTPMQTAASISTVWGMYYVEVLSLFTIAINRFTGIVFPFAHLQAGDIYWSTSMAIEGGFLLPTFVVLYVAMFIKAAKKANANQVQALAVVNNQQQQTSISLEIRYAIIGSIQSGSYLLLVISYVTPLNDTSLSSLQFAINMAIIFLFTNSNPFLLYAFSGKFRNACKSVWAELISSC